MVSFLDVSIQVFGVVLVSRMICNNDILEEFQIFAVIHFRHQMKLSAPLHKTMRAAILTANFNLKQKKLDNYHLFFNVWNCK